MNLAEWALITRDVMQKVVEQLYTMDVLYGVQWAALGRVCRQWRYCINILIATLPVKITNSAFYRTIRVGARCYLEFALLSNYPYRIHVLSNYPYSIHALSNVNSGSHQTISILAHILHQGCGINIFQLPVLNYSMQTFLKFFGYVSVWIRTFQDTRSRGRSYGRFVSFCFSQ